MTSFSNASNSMLTDKEKNLKLLSFIKSIKLELTRVEKKEERNTQIKSLAAIRVSNHCNETHLMTTTKL